jgi:Rrf2 family transcriptional regulator, nitric oxide-sensitive transcriptional repressor
MKLTKRSDYALRMLGVLLSKEVAIPVREIAEETHLSLKFLQQVGASLVKVGVLESLPGAKGGLRISGKAQDITILQVVETVEGETSLLECMQESSSCTEFEGCQIHGILGKALFAFNEVLSKATLEDLRTCPVK